MFGFDSAEIAIIAVLALIFIGPKELPRVMRTVGYWVGRVRGMARHFTSGIENMVREAELEELERKWREDNERIMRQHPPEAHYPEPGAPDTMPPVREAPPVAEPPPPEPPAAVESAEPSLPFDETQAADRVPVEQRPLP
ncbi:twin-arginine translocase TatA/TatE family subunit [Sphingomonas sp.]|uniref:Sec-independent protein translocase subunit TatA/TatB n=1 Tax=Sphingomonas sp. TaxID=28214 RepID=UPI0025D8A478|nr:twin-arginine translocase TatA/TatE family subunit [Sphingomonas sp.]MBV9526839.1 twin-arginine translocase TatA/TatE family subunit [Sphingomonas sp.]